MNDFRAHLLRRTKINRMSIKESIDNLPSGICFADENGTLVLCNRRMYELCRTLLGSDLQHMEELRQALISPADGVTTLDKDANIFRFPNGEVWQFTQSLVQDGDGKRYTQALALDITELTERRAELLHENQALLAANARARRLYHELDDIVRGEETLAMKMRVHDDIGVRLLSTRKAIKQGDTLDALRECGRAWSVLSGFFGAADEFIDGGETEMVVSSQKSLDELIHSAAGIGIRVIVDGSLPENEEQGVSYRDCRQDMRDKRCKARARG